jgi:SAM-dependent methyltransferase
VFRWSVAPIEPTFFRGKVGLDAGCGFGRSLYYAASYGADTIGMDLSEAVEAARENTRPLAGAHVIQADIFAPPIRPRVLDFVYSIGVLQHLPDPRAGFLTLTRLLAPGAPAFVWVYPRGRGRQIALWTLMRVISTRLPLRGISAGALALALGQWALWIAPYRLLHRHRPTRGLARRLPFTLYAKYPFRVLHADWVAFLPILGLGILFGFVYERTGTLLAPLAIHVAHNGGMLYLASLIKSMADFP